MIQTTGAADSGWRAGLDGAAHLRRGGMGAEIGDDPGRPRLLPRARIGARRQVNDHVERLAAGTRRTDLSGQLRELGGAGQVGGEDSVPPQRTLHRPPVRPLRPHPDRDPGALEWDRLERAPPVLGELLEALVEQPGPLPRIGDLAERLKLAVARAAKPDSEREAAG